MRYLRRMRLVARDYISSSWIELELRGELIEAIRPGEGPDQAAPADLWVAPAFWDIQLNGHGGHSFSSPELTVEQAQEIVRHQGRLGTATLCPTLITAPVSHMLHGLRTLAAACDSDPDFARRVIGIHVEGPFISEQEGYRGAHPADAICDPSPDAARRVPASRRRTDCHHDAGAERHGRDRFHPTRDRRRNRRGARTHCRPPEA